MSGCHWRLHLVIAGLGLLLANPLFAQETPPGEGPPQIEEGQPVAPDAPTAQGDGERVPEQGQPAETVDQSSTIEGRRATEDAAEARREAAEQREKDDLVAQETMAESAEELLGLTQWQIYVGGAGISLLVATLILTIRATNAAVEANKISRESVERQLRAYVFLDNKSFHVGGEAPVSGPIVRASVINAGQTPAYDLRHWIGIGFYEVPLAQTLDEGTFSATRTLGPGGSAVLEITKKAALTPEQIEALKAGKGAIYVWGRVEYRDAFKKPQFANFRLVADYVDGVAGRFMWLPEGNDAS